MMSNKKMYWSAEEIVSFMERYYGSSITWWQKLELKWFGFINRDKHYFIYDYYKWRVV